MFGFFLCNKISDIDNQLLRFSERGAILVHVEAREDEEQNYKYLEL